MYFYVASWPTSVSGFCLVVSLGEYSEQQMDILWIVGYGSASKAVMEAVIAVKSELSGPLLFSSLLTSLGRIFHSFLFREPYF